MESVSPQSGAAASAALPQEEQRVHLQHYEVLKELGECYAALSDYDRARDLYRQAAVLAPQQPGPHVGLGVVEVQCERLDLAEEAFAAALELDDKCAEAYSGLAMVHQQRRDYEAAFDMYLKCLSLDSDNLVALLGLFQTSCQMGTFSKVMYYLEVYLEKHPGDTAVLFCLGTLQAREGRLEEARQSLLNVLALAPEKNEAASLLDEVERKLARLQSGALSK